MGGDMAEAKLNREYAWRLVGVGIIMLGLAGWSVYDGSIAWPRVNEDLDAVRAELIGMTSGTGKEALTPEEWLASPKDGTSGDFRLKAVFDKAGKTVPKHLVEELSMITAPAGEDEHARAGRREAAIKLFEKPVYSKRKLHSQYIQASVTALLALMAFWAVGSKSGVRYTADEGGLGGGGFGPDDEIVPWSDVAAVDWSKWDEKGIAKVSLKSGRTVKLDSWHFVGISAIAAELEKHFPRPSAG